MRMLSNDLRPGPMPRETCSVAGIIILLTLPDMQPLFPLTAQHPHLLQTENTLTHPTSQMLSEPSLGTTRVVSNVVVPLLDITLSRANVMC